MKTTPTRTHCRFGKNGQIMRNSRRKEARKKKKDVRNVRQNEKRTLKWKREKEMKQKK